MASTSICNRPTKGWPGDGVFRRKLRQRLAASSTLLRLIAASCLAFGQLGSGGNAREVGRTSHERFDPIVRQIEGWRVHIDPALLQGDRANNGAKALAMLANHLERIRILMPPRRLEMLQRIEIWVERAHPRLKAMQYHPSRKWLIDHAYDARLAKKVHIPHAAELTSRSQLLKQPAVLLHELAHAYHDQVLAFDNPEIIAAYHNAKRSGIYENVLLYSGKRARHYGLTDHKEYFAEGTEAYFYHNDFYPFVRAELSEHDPKLFQLLERIWGPLD
jgi:dipeptidyl-peptidase-4